MSYRNAGRRRHTKGVVLFTVVAIMLFLLIMVTSTLSVVSSAQRRTYTKFRENQAYFTARSGIASFLRAAAEEDESSPLIGLHDEFYDLCVNGNIYDDTNKSFEDMDGDSDVMKMTVELPQPPQSGGDLKYLYGDCKVYVYKIGFDKAKIVARSVLGDSENIVTLYITVPKPKPNLFSNAMTSGSNITNSTIGVLGGMSAYVDPATNSLSSSDKAESDTFNFKNNGYVSRNVIIGSGATFSTQTDLVFQDIIGERTGDGCHVMEGTYKKSSPQYIGLVVMGDFNINNTPTFYSITKTKKPYIYVDGQLKISTGPRIGANFDTNSISDDDDCKINVYCNTVQFTNEPTINGDLFIYGEPENTTYAHMTSAGQDTANNVFNGKIYGDIYCNGDLTLKNNTVVSGDVYCSGTISYENLSSSNIGGKIYAATYNITGSSDLVDGTEKVNTYTSMPSEFIDKETVQTTIISTPSAQFDDFVGRDEEGNPVPGTRYPAFGYYTDINGVWKERTSVDPSWSIWNPNDYFNMNDDGKIVYIDATANNLSIVVPSTFFIANTKNNKIVVKGDKRVDFYILDSAYGSSPSNGNGNMIVTESFYNSMTAGTNLNFCCPNESHNVELNIYYWIEDNSYFHINGDMLMGYFYGPEAKLEMENGVTANNVWYDGTEFGTLSNLQFIGACVTADIDTKNQVNGIFVPSPSGGDPDKGKFWTELYYLNY